MMSHEYDIKLLFHKYLQKQDQQQNSNYSEYFILIVCLQVID